MVCVKVYDHGHHESDDNASFRSMNLEPTDQQKHNWNGTEKQGPSVSGNLTLPVELRSLLQEKEKDKAGQFLRGPWAREPATRPPTLRAP